MLPEVTIEVLRFFRVVELDHLKRLGQLLRSVIVRNASTLPLRYPHDDFFCYLSRDDLDAVQLTSKWLSEIVQTRGSLHPLRTLNVDVYSERGHFKVHAVNKLVTMMFDRWAGSTLEAFRELDRLSKHGFVANLVIRNRRKSGVIFLLQPRDLCELAARLRILSVGSLEFRKVDLSKVDKDALNAVIDALGCAKLIISRCRINADLDEALLHIRDERDNIAAEENDVTI